MALSAATASLLAAAISGTAALGSTAANVGAANNLNKKNRKWQEQQSALARDWQDQSATTAYERQRELYNDFLTPAAQVRSYIEAGLNPALAATDGKGSIPAVQSASPVSTPTPAITVPDYTMTFDFLDKLLTYRRKQAEIDNINADTDQTKKETSWIDTYNTASVDQMKAGIKQVESNLKVNEQSVAESIQRVQESVKRMEKMDSEIEVNGSIVDLHGDQRVVEQTKAAMNNLTIEKMQKLLPYVEAAREAEIQLTLAKTDEAKMSAEKNMYDANLSFLKGLVDAKLIDSSYYDNVIEQKHWDVKYKKREYKWKPINDICHNMSMLMIGAGSVMSGFGGAATGLGNAAVVSQSLAPRNPIGF